MIKEKSVIEHLKHEHRKSPLQTYLKEIVYGGNDGIVTTFAVIAGFTGAQISTNLPNYSFLIVFLFGLANLAADGLSMGLGNYLSIRAEQDAYKKELERERGELKRNREMELDETMLILKDRGFSEDDSRQLTKIYSKNEDYWLNFMMNYEHELPNPSSENPLLTALATFLAFIGFGFIPLIPFLVNSGPETSFIYSSFATFGALLLLGLLRWRITKSGIIRSVIEIMFVGGIAALAAYYVGTLFRP